MEEEIRKKQLYTVETISEVSQIYLFEHEDGGKFRFIDEFIRINKSPRRYAVELPITDPQKPQRFLLVYFVGKIGQKIYTPDQLFMDNMAVVNAPKGICGITIEPIETTTTAPPYMLNRIKMPKDHGYSNEELLKRGIDPEAERIFIRKNCVYDPKARYLIKCFRRVVKSELTGNV